VALATEASGGFGLDWTSVYPLLRGLGYWQVPLPLAETMIGAQLLSMAGLDVRTGRWR
jgi:acyl-CoA dehydrogenase